MEPFFRDEPHLRDDSADTRKEVVSIHHEDYDVGTPRTYAMGLAEQLAAFHAEARASTVEIMLRPDGAQAPFDLTTVTLEDLDLDDPLEDFDPDALLDRKTLPSAPYPPAILDDAATNLPWDVLPAAVPTFPESPDSTPEPTSDVAPSEESRAPISSSLWGKLQRFVNGISKPRSQPPVSSSSSRRFSQRAIFELVWTLDNAALDSLAAHIEHIIAVRRLGPEAYAESRIVDVLDTLYAHERGTPDGIGISILRARIPEVTRTMFDQALVRLEHRGVIALLPDEPGQDGIFDHVRGHLNRCMLLQPAV